MAETGNGTDERRLTLILMNRPTLFSPGPASARCRAFSPFVVREPLVPDPRRRSLLHRARRHTVLELDPGVGLLG